MRVAIQGEPGSNSHIATEALLGPSTLVPCALSVEVFEQLARTHEVDAAVLPVENSLHGAVADHADLLLNHDVHIVGELSLRIRHALIAAPGVTAAEVTRVLSHPVALSQCRQFFAAHRELDAVPFYDTAGAVKHLLETGVRTAAAIAAPYAAAVYGASILQEGLEDNPQNFTRFLLLSRPGSAETLRQAGAPANKISIAFELPHRPGALHAALGEIAGSGANLTRIESRPVPGRPWEYMFFVDAVLGSEAAGARLLERLTATSSYVKVLGRYAAAPPIERA